MHCCIRISKLSIILLLASSLLTATPGCSAWSSWKPTQGNRSQKLAREKSPGLFDTKPNKQQAQIDLAVVAAEQHEAKQEYREAMMKYQEVLNVDKKSSLAHHRLALIACRLSASKQAQEHFETALRLAPKDTDLIADYAYWNYLNKQYTQATELVDSGLKTTPESERFHGIKGLLLARERRFEPAVECFVKSGCTTQQAWANIGHVLLLEGDVQAASYWIEHAAQGEQGSQVAKKTQGVLQASFNAAK